MTNWTGFGGLDLSGVEAERSSNTLRPGNYICKITEAEVKDTKDKRGKGLEVTFVDKDSGGDIKDWINLKNNNAEAERIGLQKLKALLISAGHPNPDRPGDVRSIVGLMVGVRVDQGEDWTDNNGRVRPGGGKVRRSGAYFNQSAASHIGPDPRANTRREPEANTGRGASSFNDEIPF